MKTSIRINPLVSFVYMSVSFLSVMQDLLDNIGVLNHCCEFLEIQFPIPDSLAQVSIRLSQLTHPYQPP
jgi:hypothetical protein